MVPKQWKCFIAILLLSVSFSVGAQKKITNQSGSKYDFKKLVHMDATPVQSQGYTGTCWSFSALSFFESEMQRKGLENPPLLSEMFVARMAYEGKAEKFIRMDGKINFDQGGAFHDIVWVFNQYGMLPTAVYDGLNYGKEEHHHKELFSGLEGYMKGLLHFTENKGSLPLTPNWKIALKGILDAYFGVVPENFMHNGVEYTPKSFAAATNLQMADYVSITSFSHLPMYQQVQLAIPDNWLWGTSYNVTLDEMVELTKSALKAGYTVAWGADVSEKGFNFREGIAIVPKDPSTIQVKGKDNQNFSDAGAEKISNAFMQPVEEMLITPEMRQIAYDNKTTTDDHGMHITGLYEEKNTGTTFFLVKNSWGRGNYPEGYLYVSEHYFRYKTINVFLHKDGVSNSVRKKLSL
ncbi:MAG: aminopeptidase [Crocinitomicaceae bacterium]|nr:aminopeptidase [Crocinitomicaceae bacterium]